MAEVEGLAYLHRLGRSIWCVTICGIILAIRLTLSSGDIVHIDVVGTHMILLNSAEVAFSLLDEKGAIYSDRPAPHVLSKLIGWEASLSCMDQGYSFRETRRLMQQEMGSRDALAKYNTMIESEARHFLLRLIHDPCADQLKPKLRR